MNFWLEILVTVEENLGIERDGSVSQKVHGQRVVLSSKSMNDRT